MSCQLVGWTQRLQHPPYFGQTNQNVVAKNTLKHSIIFMFLFVLPIGNCWLAYCMSLTKNNCYWEVWSGNIDESKKMLVLRINSSILKFFIHDGYVYGYFWWPYSRQFYNSMKADLTKRCTLLGGIFKPHIYGRSPM